MAKSIKRNVSAQYPKTVLKGDFNPALLGDPADELLPFRSCTSPSDARAILHEQVEKEVAAMTELVSEDDAFDVIELMRMREFAIAPDPRIAPVDGASLPVEIVAALLLGRPSRKQGATLRNDTRPSEVIEELHQRCSRLTRIANYRLWTETDFRRDVMGKLAGEYVGAMLNIRNLQYDQIRDLHDSRLFESDITKELTQKYLGYSYADVYAIRTAMDDISAERMTRLRDDTGQLLMQYGHFDPKNVPSGIRKRFMSGMIPLMFLPADRSILTVADISKVSGIDESATRRVLSSFAQQFDDSISPANRVFDLLMGNDPFLMCPLISDGEDGYALTSNEIGIDVFRRLFEHSLPTNSSDLHRYDQKVRQPVSESFAEEYMEQILGVPAFRKNYHYLAPKKNVPESELRADCEAPQRFADDAEGDALFVIDDVAVIVEVKGKSMSEQSRRGDVNHLINDLKATLRNGARQTTRIQELMETNCGIWEDASSWLDLSEIREVRSVVVMLDDIGPLGTNLGELQEAEIIPKVHPPLILSLHDLAVIAQIGERPSEFLLYLRRRTDSPVTTNYRALDELDLYMLFLRAELYIENDPDQTKALYPKIPPITTSQRRKYHRSAVETVVSDECQELSLWMNRERLPEDEHPSKPSMNAPADLLKFVDQLRATGNPGWFRCGADILALSGKEQGRLLTTIKQCAKFVHVDGKYHDALLAYAGMWGFSTIFMAARPSVVSLKNAKARLLLYAKVKQYQLQADRAYGFIFSTEGLLEDTFYLNEVAHNDPALDKYILDMKLKPTDKPMPSIPPRVRLADKRHKVKRKRRK